MIVLLLHAEHEGTLGREQERLAHQAQVAQDALKRQIEASNRMLGGLSEQLPYWLSRRDGQYEAGKLLKSLNDAMPALRSLVLLDANGDIYASSQLRHAGLNFRDQAYFQHVERDSAIDRLYITPANFPSPGKGSINLSRMLAGDNGKFAGVVNASLDPGELETWLQSFNYANNMWSALLHSNGQPILRVAQARALPPPTLAQSRNWIRQHLASGLSTNVFMVADADEQLIALHSFQAPGMHLKQPLVLAFGRDIGSLLESWRKKCEVMLFLYVLLALGTSLGLTLHHRSRRQNDRQAAATAASLKESEHFLHTLLDVLPGMVGYWDVNLHNRFANSAYLEWFGKDSEQMRGLHIRELMGETLFHLNEKYIYAALHGEYQCFERTLVKTDGSTGYTMAHYIPHLVDDKVQGFFVAVSDVTEIKLSELSLREAMLKAERFREALDYAPSLIFMKDLEGHYTYANRPTLELFGVSIDELTQRTAGDFFSPDAQEKIQRMELRALSGIITSDEIDTTDLAGRRRVYWLTKTPIYSAPDKTGICGICSISTDITARKQNEEQLERAREAAEAASRAKSAFVANMSHEIRTPMNAVIGLLQVLQESGLNEIQQDYTRKARSAAESLLGILNDILDFSRIEAGKLSLDNIPLDLEQFIEQFKLLLPATPGNGPVSIRYALDPAIPHHLRGDPLRLRQVLLNLTGNAIKFTRQGEIIVSLRLLNDTPHAARIEFSVKDTGIGIAADRLDAIFEDFTQAENSTTRRYGGSGLGLAICRQLVNLMGGELKVESEPGHGSRFHFVIELTHATPQSPVARAADGNRPHSVSEDSNPFAWNSSATEATSPDNRVLPLAHAAAPEPAPQMLVGLQLLLVEDNPVNQLIVLNLLTAAGAEVEIANNGREAIAAILASPNAFDAILMDIQMPEMDGFETVRILRQEHGVSLPIIALTANALACDRNACLAAGMNEHVGKPFNTAELVRILWQHCPNRRPPAPSSLAGSKAEPEIPDLPEGFDLPGAIARLEGNFPLYASLLRGFAADRPGIGERLREYSQQQNLAAIGREAHNIKGIAATLGAQALSAQAAEVERLVRQAAGTPLLEAALVELAIRLDSCIACLLPLADRFEPQ